MPYANACKVEYLSPIKAQYMDPVYDRWKLLSMKICII